MSFKIEKTYNCTSGWNNSELRPIRERNKSFCLRKIYLQKYVQNFPLPIKVSKFHTNIFRGPKINRSFNIDLSTVKLYLQDSEKRQFRIFDRFVKTICGLHCWTKIFWDLVTFRKKYWQFKCQWQSNVMGCFAMVNKYPFLTFPADF